MSCVLLLGAGFSRNWGGWLANEAFEYLLGCPEISRNEYLRDLLWRHRASGGFEQALSEVQGFNLNPQEHEAHLDALQKAVVDMFHDMNQAFFQLTRWEPRNDKARTVATFLTKFDAIFTLRRLIDITLPICKVSR